MKVHEILFPKDSRSRRPDLRDPISNDDVVSAMKNMHRRGTHPRDILLNIEQKFGRDGIRIAKTELPNVVREAVHTIPFTKDEFAQLKDILNEPLPARDAEVRLLGILQDDGLSDEFNSVKPSTDVRPILKKWLELNIPQSVTRHDKDMMGQGEGIFSPLHGYDDKDLSIGHGAYMWGTPI